MRGDSGAGLFCLSVGPKGPIDPHPAKEGGIEKVLNQGK